MLFAALAAVCALALAPANAPAATELGSRCTAGTGGDEGVRIQTLEAAGGPTYVAPTAGIITQWGTSLSTSPGVPARLKIVAPGPGAGVWSVVGESEAAPVAAGLNVFAVRMPIAAGQSIAVYSSAHAAYCIGAPSEESAFEKYGPDVPEGGSVDPDSTTLGTRLALFAVIEPDADGDGFGDENQDLCPLRADMQTACPQVKFTKVSRSAGATALKLRVKLSAAAPVKASVSARVPKSAGRRAKTIRFKTVTKQVSPGSLKTIKLNYPKALRAALNRLPKSAKVKLTVKLTATGLVNTDKKTYRLSRRGRG